MEGLGGGWGGCGQKLGLQEASKPPGCDAKCVCVL